jgi:hypothetical protein
MLVPKDVKFLHAALACAVIAVIAYWWGGMSTTSLIQRKLNAGETRDDIIKDIVGV